MDVYKKILIFSLLKTVFFLLFFSIDKMVDSMNICKSLNINIGTVMKNPEILKFVLDHLKTKQFVSMQTKIHLIY